MCLHFGQITPVRPHLDFSILCPSMMKVLMIVILYIQIIQSIKVLKGIPEDNELEIPIPKLDKFTICLKIKQNLFSPEYQSIIVSDSFELGIFPGIKCKAMEELHGKVNH